MLKYIAWLSILFILVLTLNQQNTKKVTLLNERIEKLEKFSVLKFQLCEETPKGDKDDTKCEKYRAFDLQYDEPTEEGIMTYRIRYINEKHLEQFLDTIRRYLVELEEEHEQKKQVDL